MDRQKRPGTNADRDVLVRKETPALGSPVFVDPDDEKTDVHNASMRALAEIRELDKKLDAQKLEAARAHGALKTEVLGLKTTVEKVDQKLDRIAEGHASVAGKLEVVLADRGRPRSDSAQRRAVMLAEQVLGKERDRQGFKHAALLQVLSGLFAVAVAAVALVRSC
jgi:hypothetical protein